MLAIAAPVVVALAAAVLDPLAGLILALTGLLVPVAMALSGLGAAAASRDQFLALARLQARFLDRVRGIATIVLHGRAEDEARSLAAAADELRVRTMRVLRVAFLSSAALDLAAALALVVLALRYGQQWREGALTDPRAALFVLLLVPEFFAPLRAFSAAYQDRLHATGGGRGADRPAAAAGRRGRRARSAPSRRSGVSVPFEDVRLTWDQSRGPALNGLTFRVPAGETLVLAGPSGAGKSTVIEILLGFVRPDSGRVTINGATSPTSCRRRCPPDRLDRPASGAVRRHDPRQHPVRPARSDRRTKWRRRCAQRGSTGSPARCRTGWTPRSARAATACPAARRSASRSPARS